MNSSLVRTEYDKNSNTLRVTECIPPEKLDKISISIKKKSNNSEVLEKINKILLILERICDELVIDFKDESDDDEVFMYDSDDEHEMCIDCGINPRHTEDEIRGPMKVCLKCLKEKYCVYKNGVYLYPVAY